MDRQFDTLSDARTSLKSYCISESFPGNIHAVTFQPDPSRENQDRHVVQEWDDISVTGTPWLFLAVLDGHSGSEVAEHTAKHLPGRLRAVLSSMMQTELNPTAESISDMLRVQVEEFDREIGQAFKDHAPDPASCDDAQIDDIVHGPHASVFTLAGHGTTLSAALIDGEKGRMWVLGLGDSSVVLSQMQPDGTRDGELLLQLHNLDNSHERDRLLSEHPNESELILGSRVLGRAEFTRSIGDFHFKFSPALTAPFLSKTWDFGSRVREAEIIRLKEDIITPPYVIPTCDVRFIDLVPLRARKPILLLYTDGVDSIVTEKWTYCPRQRDSAQIMGALLGEHIDEQIEYLLRHRVEPRWDENRALELLGNIAGGTNGKAFGRLLSGEYIDDTTIVCCPLY